jgi:hypothetical protein
MAKGTFIRYFEELPVGPHYTFKPLWRLFFGMDHDAVYWMDEIGSCYKYMPDKYPLEISMVMVPADMMIR